MMNTLGRFVSFVFLVLLVRLVLVILVLLFVFVSVLCVLLVATRSLIWAHCIRLCVIAHLVCFNPQ